MRVLKIAQFVYRFVHKMSKDRVRAHAAEAGFFLIMSFFPILMLLLALLRYTPLTTEQVVLAIEEITPFEVTSQIQPVVDSVFQQASAMVPWTIVVALWTAGKGILGLSDGLNSVYQTEESRNYVVLRLRCMCYTIVLVLALIVGLGILVFGYGIESYLLEKLPFLAPYEEAMFVLPTGTALLILIVLFSVLYTALPNRKLSFFRQIPGAIFTALSWSVFSYAFSIYLDFAGNMSVIYGSLTTLVVVMLWLYFCIYLLFMGAEVNQYLQNPETFALDR